MRSAQIFRAEAIETSDFGMSMGRNRGNMLWSKRVFNGISGYLVGDVLRTGDETSVFLSFVLPFGGRIST